jgi:hypothetical protein
MFANWLLKLFFSAAHNLYNNTTVGVRAHNLEAKSNLDGGKGRGPAVNLLNA